MHISSSGPSLRSNADRSFHTSQSSHVRYTREVRLDSSSASPAPIGCCKVDRPCFALCKRRQIYIKPTLPLGSKMGSLCSLVTEGHLRYDSTTISSRTPTETISDENIEPNVCRSHFSKTISSETVAEAIFRLQILSQTPAEATF